ncbi:MAG TPA: energy transducer TonB [Novosphingobium sp.]|nr:energy transducer TonB [Novosphingobium sp.]
MAYADQEVSGNRIAAFVVVALLHLALGYALVTGLAYEGFKQVMKKVTTVDIKKDEPKKEPPPPPKKAAAAPPIVAPPPKVSLTNVSPPVEITQNIPPPAPPPIVVAPPAPVAAPPPPPAPKFQPKPATPKGNPGNWATTNDYPSRALREEREGVTGFRVSVGPDGRVTGCSVTASSGSSDLDDATCANVTRRARFNPAMDGEGQPTTGSYSGRVRWVIPKD